MYKFFANTERKPASIDLGVQSLFPCKVRVQALDPNKKGAVYMDRVMTVSGTQDFVISLPQSPKKLLIIVSGNVDNNNLRVTKLEKAKLKSYRSCLKGSKVKNFVKFAKDFCENAGILSAGRYVSDNGKYVIDYFPVIKDKGKVLTTPARISNKTGRMEVSQKAFRRMTIPMRMAILCHEFSHFYMNKVTTDEIEADLNALKIYLGMGYPVIEAHKAFLETFMKYPSETNKERYEYLKTFMDNWETNKFQFCLT